MFPETNRLSEQNLKKTPKTAGRETIQGMKQGDASKVLFCFFYLFHSAGARQNFKFYSIIQAHYIYFFHFQNFAITWMLVQIKWKQKDAEASLSSKVAYQLASGHFYQCFRLHMELFVRGGWFKEASKKMRMTTLL